MLLRNEMRENFHHITGQWFIPSSHVKSSSSCPQRCFYLVPNKPLWILIGFASDWEFYINLLFRVFPLRRAFCYGHHSLKRIKMLNCHTIHPPSCITCFFDWKYTKNRRGWTYWRIQTAHTSPACNRGTITQQHIPPLWWTKNMQNCGFLSQTLGGGERVSRSRRWSRSWKNTQKYQILHFIV